MGIDLTIESKAISVLEQYEGANNYILNLKQKLVLNSKFYPTRSQSEYILTNKDKIPKVAKKWVVLDSYFSNKLADDKFMIQIPDRLWIEKLLAEKDKAYHIWGRFFESEPLTDFWVPKVSIIKDNKVEIKEIDYSKYSHRPPLEHQKTAVESLLKNRKFILADDMGLGKTTSTIIAALETGVKKILIICPATLKINWEREFWLYSQMKTYVCDGKNFSADADIVIMNYDIIKNFHDTKNIEKSLILNSKFELVIIDEAHYIQNVQAQRTKLINDLVKTVSRIWLLTGTPMTSRPINYFNLLSLVDSPVAKNWMAYVIRYCSGYQFKVGPRKIWNVMGASNLEELRDRTSPTVLRRLKEDVLDLPEKIITPVYLRLRSKQYEEVMGDYYNWYERNPQESKNLSIQFTKLIEVRQVIAEEKTQHTIEIAENIIEQGKKVIIFCNFTKSLETIFEHFGKSAVRLDGQMSKVQRQNSVDRFQEDEKIKVFVGNIKAAGVGITLTAGEAVIMNDLSFLPSDHAQSEDRAYRYGQKNNVLVYYPIFDNTIEGIIYDILAAKKRIIGTVMGDIQQEETNTVEEILKSISKRQ